MGGRNKAGRSANAGAANMIKNIVGIIVALIAIAGGVVGAIEYFAKDADLKELAMNFEQSRKNQEILYINQRIYQLEDRYGNRPCCDGWFQLDKDEYRRLRDRKKELERAP